MALLAVVALLATTGGQAWAARDTGGGKARGTGRGNNGLYIVQLLDQPAVAYTGGVAGLKGTKPNKGQKLDPNSPDVVKYVDYLDGKHNAKVAAVGGRKVYSYHYTFNGFAAELTAAQAAKLSADPEVVAVTKDSLSKLDTSRTPSFLGLDAPGGVWSKLSGSTNPIIANGPNSGGAGEGIVVGIVDSGVWPENPSFSDRDAEGKLVFQQLPGWNGKCVPGEQFAASSCNQKLIAAQWYGEGFGGAAGIKASFPYEFVSARGADGHGSHTASTAAGNFGVDAVIDGTNLGKISGMAPRARVAVYKSCWGIPPEGGCFTSDSVAAIDQAVADGVDVINFSISGSLTSFLDPVEVAFLFAADAGVFVAASAGNSGPAASTVAHNSPWLTTVAAGTHDRVYRASVTLGDGSIYTGVGLGAAVPSAPLILSDNVGLPGADATQVRLCFSGTLDPAKVEGKIVVCDRGINARTDKSLAVKQARGVGMILVNTSPNSLNADFHSVPTVHLQSTDRAAVRAYVTANSGSATAALGKGEQVGGAAAPDVASFSSRGPALAGGGDLLKPDILAPGVDILAAVSPVEAGRNFDFLSGTSMSSPHMAGLAALMKQLYPGWSPAAIKSAFMTSSTLARNNGSPIAGGPFDYGAGHVVPNSAMDPGLVYDSGWTDWLGFLCGTGQLQASYCPQIRIDPSDLNYPSIAIGDLAGTQTVKRTVTNVSGKKLTVSASVSGLAGVNAVVTPASLTLNPGEAKSFTVQFTTAGAALNAYTTGQLTWAGGVYTVRSPLVVRPVALAAPASINGTGGPISYGVTFGYAGSFSATPRGLVPAAITAGTVNQDPDQTFEPADPTGTVAVQVNVPAGTTYARFELFDADVAPGSDMDLYVYLGGNRVGASAGGTSAEQVNLANPAAGTYTVYVHGWGLPSGSSPFKLHTWLLGSASAGNMAVSAPASATLGAPGTINLTFSGLAPATKYLGSVAYSGATGMPSPTIVRVDTP
jgi:hypothetical protein